MNQLNQFDTLAEKRNLTWREKHDAYMLSDHWKDLRQRCFVNAKHACEACGSKNHLQGHHLRYRDPIESGVLDDIMALCERCHRLLHATIKQDGQYLSNHTRKSTWGLLRILLIEKLIPEKRAREQQSKSAKKRAAKVAKREERLQRIAERKKKRQIDRGGIPIVGMSVAEIEAMRSPRGGFTKHILQAMGVPWPPPKGWRRQLIANHKAATGALDYSI